MFADEILNSHLWMIAEESRKRFSDDLIDAHKFVFEERTMKAVLEIGNRTPLNLYKCLQWATIPFDVTWIEFPIDYPRDFEFNGKITHITKFGLLYQTMEGGNSGLINIFYKFTDGTISNCLYHILFDWVGDTKLRSYSAEQHGVSEFEYTVHLADQLDKQREIYKIEEGEDELYIKFAGDVFGIHYSGLIDPDTLNIDKISKDVLENMQETENDIALTCTRLSLAAILLINCRQGVIVEDVQMGKINKRRNMKKFRPHFEHKTVMLELFKTTFIKHGTGGHVDNRAHWVMGHFKRRDTGIFWWSPHIRGDGGVGWIDKDYKL